MEFDVLVITPTVFCDLIFTGLPGIPGPGQEFYAQGFALCPGGMGGNSATALVRLGMRVGLVSRIGRFPLGEILHRQLEAEGIDLTHVQLVDEEPTAVSVAMSLSSDRCFVTYPPPTRAAGSMPLPLDYGVLGQARHALLGGPGATRDQLARIRERGIGIALDIGWDATENPRAVFDLLPLVDIFVPNELEASRLTGASDPHEAIKILGRYVRLPIIKLGARGSMGLKEGQVIEVPTINVKPIDTTGAGDVFVAGLLYGYLRGWDIERCLRLANICGALSTRGIGGGRSAPRWDDILRVAPEFGIDEQVGCIR